MGSEWNCRTAVAVGKARVCCGRREARWPVCTRGCDLLSQPTTRQPAWGADDSFHLRSLMGGGPSHHKSDRSVSNTENRVPRRGRMLCGASEHAGSRGGFGGRLGTQRLECVDLSYCVYCLPYIPSPNTRIQDLRLNGRKRWGRPKR